MLQRSVGFEGNVFRSGPSTGCCLGQVVFFLLRKKDAEASRSFPGRQAKIIRWLGSENQMDWVKLEVYNLLLLACCFS